MSFASPWLLLALPFLALAVVYLVRAQGHTVERATSIARPGAIHRVRLAPFVYGAALALAVVAAAQPRWGADPAQVEREGADVLFVLDASRGMAAEDVPPSRFVAVQEAVLATIDGLDGDRVGLVTFGGTASLRFPMTTDISAARAALRVIEPGSIFVGAGTDIAVALDRATEALAPDTGRGRLAILVTDGEHLAESDVEHAASNLGRAGIDLVVLGVGTAEGASVPVFNRRDGEVQTLRSPTGEPVVSRLDEATLLRVARAAGGVYAGPDPARLPGVVQARMASLQSSRIDVRSTDIPTERFHWFALAAAALLVAAMSAGGVARLGSRIRWRQGGTAGLLALAGLAIGSCADAAHRTNERGLDAFEQGDYVAAASHFRDAEREAPGDFQVALNLAAAFHAAGDGDRAVTAASRALAAANPGIRAAAYATIGHGAFARGDYAAALAAFRAALRADPTDEHRHNYEVVLRLVEAADPVDEPGEPGEPVDGGADGDNAPTPAGDPGTTPTPGPDGDADNGNGSDAPASGPETLIETDQALTEIDARIDELSPPDGATLSPVEARALLDLLAERARLAVLREALEGGAVPPSDY